MIQPHMNSNWAKAGSALLHIDQLPPGFSMKPGCCLKSGHRRKEVLSDSHIAKQSVIYQTVCTTCILPQACPYYHTLWERLFNLTKFNMQTLSHDSLYQKLISQFNPIHTHPLFLIEIKTNHISFLQVIIVKIFRQLFLAPFVVFLSAPDFHFHNKLFALVIYDNICPSGIPGPGFNVIISYTIYDRF